jgi:hypothetical protein
VTRWRPSPIEFVVTSVGSATSKYVLTLTRSPERIPGLDTRHEPRKETQRWGYRNLIVYARDRIDAAHRLLAHVQVGNIALTEIVPLRPSIEERPACEGALAAG